MVQSAGRDRLMSLSSCRVSISWISVHCDCYRTGVLVDTRQSLPVAALVHAAQRYALDCRKGGRVAAKLRS